MLKEKTNRFQAAAVGELWGDAGEVVVDCNAKVRVAIVVVHPDENSWPVRDCFMGLLSGEFMKAEKKRRTTN